MSEEINVLHEIHEDRIQKLEAGVNETNIKLENHGVKLEHIQAQVEDFKVSVGQKIDEGFQSIHQEIQKTNEAVGTLTTTVRVHGTKLSKIEEKQEKKAARLALVKKILWYVMIAVIGAATKEGGIFLLHTLHLIGH